MSLRFPVVNARYHIRIALPGRFLITDYTDEIAIGQVIGCFDTLYHERMAIIYWIKFCGKSNPAAGVPLP